MKLEILTPEKKLFKGEVRSVSLPGKKGSFMILDNHAPIVSTLAKGTITVLTKDYKEENINVLGGVIEANRNNIIVLADV